MAANWKSQVTFKLDNYEQYWDDANKINTEAHSFYNADYRFHEWIHDGLKYRGMATNPKKSGGQPVMNGLVRIESDKNVTEGTYLKGKKHGLHRELHPDKTKLLLYVDDE